MRVVADIHSGAVTPRHREVLAYMTASSRGPLLSIVTAGVTGRLFVTLKVKAPAADHGRDSLASITEALATLRHDPTCPPELLLHLERATRALPALAQDACHRMEGLSTNQLGIAKDMLSKRLNQAVTVSDVALACGISRGHLNRGFRQMVGAPPMRWRMEARLSECRRLLLETDRPVAAIAMAAGFSDPCYFSRAFTHATGMSPRDWRRTFRDRSERPMPADMT